MSLNQNATLWKESVSQVTDTNSVALGTRRVENGVEYIYCYNGGTASSLAGTFMRIQSNCSGYTVDNATTTAVGQVFCNVRNTAVSAGQYFWGAVKGHVPLRGSITTIAPGSPISILGSGLVGGTGTAASGFSGYLPVYNCVVLVSVETESSNLTGWGYINLG